MLIFSLLVFFLLSVHSDPYLYMSVEILDCGDGQTISGATKPRDKIQCAGTTDKYQLGREDQVIIHSVTYETKAETTKENLCKKIASNNYDIKFAATTPKLKNLIYSENGAYKAILTGTTETCYTSLIVPDDILKKGYLHVTTISCIPETIAKKLKDSKDSKETSKYHMDGTNICFLAPMLSEKLETEVVIESKKYKLVVSAYPKKDCPICESSATPKPDETPNKS